MKLVPGKIGVNEVKHMMRSVCQVESDHDPKEGHDQVVKILKEI